MRRALAQACAISTARAERAQLASETARRSSSSRPSCTRPDDGRATGAQPAAPSLGVACERERDARELRVGKGAGADAADRLDTSHATPSRASAAMHAFGARAKLVERGAEQGERRDLAHGARAGSR